jgi:hypothetical protein
VADSNAELTREVLGMTEGWFFEEELSRLRWEWVDALREYGRQRDEASLRRVRETCDAYTRRAARLRRDERRGAGVSSTS